MNAVTQESQTAMQVSQFDQGELPVAATNTAAPILGSAGMDSMMRLGEAAPFKLSKELLAGLMTGREYGKEMAKEEEMQAKAAGLIVIFGASDDLMEFRGAIHDEFSAYDGGTALVFSGGCLPEWEYFDEKDDEEMSRKYFAQKALARKVDALWCAEPGYSWTYRTDVPHATFEIVEDGEPYCRGIVIDVADLGGAA
jgi:hypothetical protein